MPVLMLLVLAALTLMAGGVRDTVHPADALVWEQPTMKYEAKPGEVSAKFVFKVKNTSASEVVVNDIKPSCGCTIAPLPGHPWRLAPGETSQFEALVNLRDKTGVFSPPGQYPKEIDVIRANTTNNLLAVINVPIGLTNSLTTREMDRLWGQQLAAVDHQAVFKNDCVQCHLTAAFGKTGEKLYVAACGICHEATHRASVVPDLHTKPLPGDSNYWHNIVANGKPGTLMPGFAATLGGPLDDAQMKSLVEYLMKAFPQPPQAAIQTNAAR